MNNRCLPGFVKTRRLSPKAITHVQPPCLCDALSLSFSLLAHALLLALSLCLCTNRHSAETNALSISLFLTHALIYLCALGLEKKGWIMVWRLILKIDHVTGMVNLVHC
jgi:hypothetical protein